MSTDIPTTPVNWDDLEDTDSDDSEDTESDKASNDSKDNPEEEEKHIRYGQKGRQPYGDNRGYKSGHGGFNQADPKGNYYQYYRNDPNFFVTVIKQEEPPHELCVKVFSKYKGDLLEMTEDELYKILAQFD